MRCIDELSREELEGKTVLLRASLNVPIEDGKVTDTFRLERALPTIEFLKENGARVVVIAHLGRDPKETLAPVCEALNELTSISFVPDLLGQEARARIAKLHDGGAIMLENLRQHEEEKENETGFVNGLSTLADLYVNDAFAVAHRKHASIVGVPTHMKSFAGFLMRDEVEHLTLALEPQHMAIAFLGGAKFQTKEPLIEKLIERYDYVFIGGALANDIFLAKGYEVGESLVSDEKPSEEALFHEKVIAPADVVVINKEGNTRTILPYEVAPDEKIVDIGPESLEALHSRIHDARFILWNGPMGLYEGGFDKQTCKLAQLIAESHAQTVVGGGDTVASIRSENLEADFSFISTGGGAMLEFLLKGSLPGVDALSDS